MSAGAGEPWAEGAGAASVLAAVLRSRRGILRSALLTSLLVAAGVLVMPREFTSTASFLPVTGRASGNLAGLAASLGFNLSGIEMNQSPAFYADLVTAPTILLPLVEHPFHSSDSTQPPVTLETVFHVSAASSPLLRERAVSKLRDRVHVTLRTRTGVVQVDVTMRDPAMAHDVAVRLLDQLMQYNVSSRQSQAAAERRFTQQRTAEARDELRGAEDTLRRFLRGNRDTQSSPDLRFQEDRLRREVSLRQQIYTTLAEAYERARIDEVRDTPLLTIVEPPRVPARPDSRHVAFKVVLGLFVGGLVATLLVLARTSLTPSPAVGAEALQELRLQWSATKRDARHPIQALFGNLRSAGERI